MRHEKLSPRTSRLFGNQLRRIDELRTRRELLNPDVIPFVAQDTLLLTEMDYVPIQDLQPGQKVFSPDARGFIRVEDVLQPDEFMYPSLVSKHFKVGMRGENRDLFVSMGCVVEVRCQNWRSPQSITSVRKWRSLDEFDTQKCGSGFFYCIVLKAAGSVCANGAKVSSARFEDVYG